MMAELFSEQVEAAANEAADDLITLMDTVLGYYLQSVTLTRDQLGSVIKSGWIRGAQWESDRQKALRRNNNG